jgi:uncharacterized membrane protein
MVTFGCKSTSERGGGAPTDQGFKIVVPTSVDIKQGETKTTTVRLNRGDYFKRDVRLTMQVSGQGVTVEPAEAVVEASQPAEVQVRVSALPNAALGEYRVNVTGTPEAGVPTSVQFPVQVKAP